MAATQTFAPTVDSYKLPLKPSRPYRRQDELGWCSSPREIDELDILPSATIEPVRSWDRFDRPEKRRYTSPRCTVSDDKLFPADHRRYRTGVRWQRISEQAGSHRQDGSVLTIRRNINPNSLKMGMTKQAASRVRKLNLWLDHNEDILPEWLDIVAFLFPDLQHLTLTDDLFPGEEDLAVSARMRRLYVLYRLPDLTSIDGMLVTRTERKLARPTSPNANRVKRDDWIASESLLDEEDDDEDDEEDEDDDKSQIDFYRFGDDAGELPRIPAADSISNHTAKELGVEFNQELVDRIAEMHSSDESDTFGKDLVGEELLDESADCSSSGEHGEDESSGCGGPLPGDREVASRYRDRLLQPHTPQSFSSDAVEVGLNGTVESVRITRSRSIPADTLPKNKRLSVDVDRDSHASGPPPPVEGYPDEIQHSDTLELISVASSHHEWSATCGVLSFRSGKSCAPRVRLALCGRDGRKRLTNGEAVLARLREKHALRHSQDLMSSCTPVHRHSLTSSHSAGGDSSRGSKFFPSNQNPSSEQTSQTNSNRYDSQPLQRRKISPSKSLSSPFPMQFRKRKVAAKESPPNNRVDIKAPETTHLNGTMAAASAQSSKEAEPVVIYAPKRKAGMGEHRRDDEKDSERRSEMETISKPLPTERMNSYTRKAGSPPSRPAAKGDLPPPCPGGASRKLAKSSAASPLRSKKSRRRARLSKASKENARSTSVMDFEDDDDDEDIDDDDDEFDRYATEVSRSDSDN